MAIKLRNRIVSLGLIPIIVTLIGLHFFPNTEMLGIGFVLSILMLLYNIIKMKDLNFFLLLGTLGIGTCFILRLFWGYKYVPLNSITPTVEFFLMIFAFLYYTAPEIYKNIVGKLGIRVCFSYKLETKIIIILSSLHLTLLYIIASVNHNWSTEGRFFMINIIPVSIYIICLIVNTVGIHIAAKMDINKHNIIRVAPICNGKIFLSKKYPIENRMAVQWDLPIEKSYEGSIKDCEQYTTKNTRKITANNIKPRIILRYCEECSCGIKNNILLFILPLQKESDIINLDGQFFNFNEIEETSSNYSMNLQKELEHLKNAANIWKEYYL